MLRGTKGIRCDCKNPRTTECAKCGRPLCDDCAKTHYRHVDGHLMSTFSLCWACVDIMHQEANREQERVYREWLLKNQQTNQVLKEERMFGEKVTITLKIADTTFTEEYRNVTEIHFNYNREYSNEPDIAFESDIHGTGITRLFAHVVEFRATPETELAESF